MVTLSTASIYKGTTYLLTQMVPVSNIPKDFINIGQGYIGFIPIPVVIMVIMLLIMWFVVKKTLFGRNVLAMGGNQEAARVCGINVQRETTAVFMVMGIYAAVAAFVLTGRSASAQVAAGQGMEMNAIAAVVLGGTPMGGGYAFVPNTLVGCLIVGVVANLLNLMNVDVNWQEVAKGALILFAIILDSQSNAIKARLDRKSQLTTGASGALGERNEV
jgi:ribose/xylose/arabinose/galactoside ABC-type transport system permease subunit